MTLLRRVGTDGSAVQHGSGGAWVRNGPRFPVPLCEVLDVSTCPTAALLVRSRRGADMTASFPQVVPASGQLPDATASDGEMGVWEADLLAFERLRDRVQRRGAAADPRRTDT